ncbi:hypothetical protein GGI43DRAFT_55741 [Trichoderma evansii]
MKSLWIQATLLIIFGFGQIRAFSCKDLGFIELPCCDECDLYHYTGCQLKDDREVCEDYTCCIPPPPDSYVVCAKAQEDI